MTDEPHDDGKDETPPATPDRPPPDRRGFLRQLSGDAVVTAGKMAGLSTLLTRSISAAGASVARDLETLGGGKATDATDTIGAIDTPSTSLPDGTSPDAAATRDAPEPPDQPIAPTAIDATTPSVSPAIERLTADQRTVLAAATAGTLAVNDRSGAPHVTMTALTWDGASFVIPAQLFGARSGHIDADPRVTLLIEDASTGSWVTVTGIATLEDPDPATDRVTIRVRPTAFVWRPASPRRASPT